MYTSFEFERHRNSTSSPLRSFSPRTARFIAGCYGQTVGPDTLEILESSVDSIYFLGSGFMKDPPTISIISIVFIGFMV